VSFELIAAKEANYPKALMCLALGALPLWPPRLPDPVPIAASPRAAAARRALPSTEGVNRAILAGKVSALITKKIL